MQQRKTNQITADVFTPLDKHQKEKAIRYIFSVFQATYGNCFVNNFKSGYNDTDGIDIGLKTAHKFWLKKLDFFLNNKEGQEAIKKALDELPIRPPNLIEFFEIVKNLWSRFDQQREQQLRMQETQNAQKLTPEQQKAQNLKIQELMQQVKNLFKTNNNSKMFD